MDTLLYKQKFSRTNWVNTDLCLAFIDNSHYQRFGGAAGRGIHINDTRLWSTMQSTDWTLSTVPAFKSNSVRINLSARSVLKTLGIIILRRTLFTSVHCRGRPCPYHIQVFLAATDTRKCNTKFSFLSLYGKN